MTIAVQALLDSFDALSEGERYDVAVELLRRVVAVGRTTRRGAGGGGRRGVPRVGRAGGGGCRPRGAVRSGSSI